MKRRSFLKSTFMTAISTFAAGSLVTVQNLLAKALPDSAIKKFKYIHDAVTTAPKNAQFKNHKKKVAKLKAKHTDLKLPTDNPVCMYCSQYSKQDESGFGYCKLVAKEKNKKGEKVFKNGWCQMFKVQKDVKKIKAFIALG